MRNRNRSLMYRPHSTGLTDRSRMLFFLNLLNHLRQIEGHRPSKTKKKKKSKLGNLIDAHFLFNCETSFTVFRRHCKLPLQKSEQNEFYSRDTTPKKKFLTSGRNETQRVFFLSSLFGSQLLDRTEKRFF